MKSSTWLVPAYKHASLHRLGSGWWKQWSVSVTLVFGELTRSSNTGSSRPAWVTGRPCLRKQQQTKPNKKLSIPPLVANWNVARWRSICSVCARSWTFAVQFQTRQTTLLSKTTAHWRTKQERESLLKGTAISCLPSTLEGGSPLNPLLQDLGGHLDQQALPELHPVSFSCTLNTFFFFKLKEGF